MRTIHWLALIAMAAGCGDNNRPNGPVDARSNDSNGDAMVDGSINSTSRVWAIGNYITDTKRQAGAFTDGATLPFGNGTPTPIVVPSGTSVLASSANYTTQIFDASVDGKKLAFVADLTSAGRFDLYVAGSTGGSPTLLVTGGTLNVEIASVSISPNGSKIAFTMDSTAIDGGYDLYWISTSGSGTPVKVSPDRPLTGVTNYAALDVSPTVFWSADSRYLGFIGDLTEDTYNQAYVADTNTTNGAAELVARADIPTSGSAQGVLLMAFDSSGKVYYTGRLSMTSPDIQLYRSNPDGSSKTDLTSLVPLRSDNSTPDIGSMGMSPDGTKLALAADTPTAAHYDIFVNTIGASSASNVSNFSMDWSPNGFLPLAFSPNSTSIAALGRYSADSRQNAFVASGGSGHRVTNASASCGGCTTPDVVQLAWSMDSANLFVRGDITANGVSKLYRVSAAMTDQATPTLAVDSPPTADVLNVIVRPAM